MRLDCSGAGWHHIERWGEVCAHVYYARIPLKISKYKKNLEYPDCPSPKISKCQTDCKTNLIRKVLSVRVYLPELTLRDFRGGGVKKNTLYILKHGGDVPILVGKSPYENT